MLESAQWIFLTGCQRSGTTLSRLVLESHPDIFCFDEVDGYDVLRDRRWSEPISRPHVLFKVPRLAEQIDSPVLRDEGIAPIAGPIYHGQPILFLIRDWRDVVASMLKLDGWLDRHGWPIIAAKMADTPGFSARWAEALAICARSANRPVAIGALYWAYKNEAVFDYLAKGYPVLPVRYERLVRTPQQQIPALCSFLDLPFAPAMLDHTTARHREVFDSGLTVGNTDPARRISDTSVAQWQHIGDAAFWEEGRAIVGDLPSRLEALCAGAVRA